MDLVNELAESNAVWHHQDGSVNLEHIDNEFHHLKIVTKRGKLKHRFLSVEEKNYRGANGQFDCLQRSMASIFPNSGYVDPKHISNLIIEKHELNTDILQTLQNQNNDNGLATHSGAMTSDEIHMRMNAPF